MVRRTDGCRLDHTRERRVSKQSLLDLAGIMVDAAADYEVIAATENVPHTIGIDLDTVGMEPQVVAA